MIKPTLEVVTMIAVAVGMTVALAFVVAAFAPSWPTPNDPVNQRIDRSFSTFHKEN